ncbi:MAG: NAD(P)-dependent alcohol dehydrogenase [Pseudomonadota bacterium]
MRVVSLEGGFGFDRLALRERPEPSCGPRQVLLRVLAVSINARDVMMVRGEYNPRQRLPLVVCSDALGEVVARGAGVDEWQLGQRVCPIFAGLWSSGALTRDVQRSSLGGPLDGTLREYMTVDAAALVPAPPHLSATEAACLPCAGVTAYRALIELGQLRAGQTLVCQGTGGVSLFGLLLAKACGARVIITSRSAQKLERAVALGADHGIDTSHTLEWAKQVRGLTNLEGADHVLEVGGASTFAESVRALRVGGTLSVIGVLSGALTEVDLRPILMQDLRVQGVFVGSRQSFLGLLTLFAQQQLRPPVDRVFPLGEARAAFEYAASGQQFGKVVISLEE